MEHLRHIKNRVIAFQKGGRTVIYVKSRINKSLFDWQRRLRIRTALFGHTFTTYHPNMDFTNSLKCGWTEVDC